MKPILAIILSIYLSFFAGLGGYFFIDKYLIEPNEPKCLKCSNPTDNPKTAYSLDLTDFDILLVSPENPNVMFHVNHLDNRTENYKTTFLNYTLDGTTLKSVQIPFENITWEHIPSNDANGNSVYKITGVFTIENKIIYFEVPSINLTMNIRAQPDAGKYGGVTADPSTLLKIDNTDYYSYAAVTAGFFTNYPTINMEKAGIRTHWAMYFDKDYNFYHLDLTNVQNPTPDYYSHAFLSQIKNEDDSVVYYTPTRLIGGNGGISLGYSKGLDFITKDFNQVGQTNPYRYAKMNIIKEDAGGMGVYSYIDSTK